MCIRAPLPVELQGSIPRLRLVESWIETFRSPAGPDDDRVDHPPPLAFWKEASSELLASDCGMGGMFLRSIDGFPTWSLIRMGRAWTSS